MRSTLPQAVVLSSLLVSLGCAGADEDSDSGTGGSGATATGGALTGGMIGSGGLGTGGALPTGGMPTGGWATGGAPTGGVPTGGAVTGGAATGGAATGGDGTGGDGTGGDGTGGDGTGGGSTTVVDCNTPMPTGGTPHCGQNTQGSAGGLSWSLWSNSLNSNSCITTYDTTAFGASWVESGDFLARLGLEYRDPQPYTSYGTIEAHFAYTKTGDGGGFSYIGMYGWSVEPCVEWYIVEDSWNRFPFDAWNAQHTGTAPIDGEDYKLFRNSTRGTGGSRCNQGEQEWDQFWSIRQSARQCGVISVTDHFNAWVDAGMNMGKVLEAKILVEVGGGAGSIDFPVANVIAE